MTPFHLLVLAVAVYRATRLITTDGISDRFREWVRAAGWGTTARSGSVPKERPGRLRAIARKLSVLVTCPWCVSMYLGGLAIGTFLTWQTPVLDVAYVLACSALTGILAERT